MTDRRRDVEAEIRREIANREYDAVPDLADLLYWADHVKQLREALVEAEFMIRHEYSGSRLYERWRAEHPVLDEIGLDEGTSG